MSTINGIKVVDLVKVQVLRELADEEERIGQGDRDEHARVAGWLRDKAAALEAEVKGSSDEV